MLLAAWISLLEAFSTDCFYFLWSELQLLEEEIFSFELF